MTRRLVLVGALVPLLAHGGRLRVSVTDPRGAPVRDSDVTVTFADGTRKRDRTDAGGSAVFENAADGECVIEAAAGGFPVWRGTHRVQRGEANQVEARLTLARHEERVEVKESLGRRFRNWLTSCTRR